jgi:hypothetical protein
LKAFFIRSIVIDSLESIPGEAVERCLVMGMDPTLQTGLKIHSPHLRGWIEIRGLADRTDERCNPVLKGTV